MKRLAVFVAITCATVLAVAAARAETLGDLKAELAAKKADVAKLERRTRQVEGQAAGGVPPASETGAPPLFVAPSTGPTTRPPIIPAAAAPSADDAELERALERTLVREGALVLPPWRFQLTPQFSYGHWDKIQDPFISNTYSGALSVAMGLPWQSQISVSVPYVFDQGRDGNPSSSGFADVGFLLSKELLLDNGPTPNLVGSVGWTSPTSRSSAVGPIPYVSGFQAGFTASKRLDPLVVFLSGSYFSAAEVAGLEFNPANVVG